MEADSIPNKEKAAIIELTGELPAAGHMFLARKGHPYQYEIPENEYWKIKGRAQSCPVFYNTSYILIDNCRVLQRTDSPDILLINEMYHSIIDFTSMDDNYESKPIGPVASDLKSPVVYWENEICSLAICIAAAADEHQQDIIDKLSMARL